MLTIAISQAKFLLWQIQHPFQQLLVHIAMLESSVSPAAPWSPVPSDQLAIMPPGVPPAPPRGPPPNGPYSTPASGGGGGGSSANSEIVCKKNEVQRCDSKGKRHSSASDNTHIQILSGDIVDLKALTAVTIMDQGSALAC